MKKKILIGSIIAVVLLTLVSFSSVVGYNSVKSNPDNAIITDEYDSYTPIQLVFQLISKLRNHKDIENVETENDLLQIVEGDKELNSIVELSVEDCGCEDKSILGSNTSILCWILFSFIFLGILLIPIIGYQLIDLLGVIGKELNCFWFPN